MALTGRQLAGALASLGLAVGILWPTRPRAGEQASGTAASSVHGAGCPFGYGGTRDNGDGGGGGDGHALHGPPSSSPSAATGTRIFTNASFWTGDATVPWAEAMAVTDAGRGRAHPRPFPFFAWSWLFCFFPASSRDENHGTRVLVAVLAWTTTTHDCKARLLNFASCAPRDGP